MEQKDYSSMLPNEPPKELIPWLEKKGLLNIDVLVFKMDSVYEPLEDRKVRMVHVKCSACHKDFWAEKVENECHCGGPAFGFIHPECGEVVGDGTVTTCPKCGAYVTARHAVGTSKERRRLWPLTISKIDGKLVLLGWCVEIIFDANADKSIVTHPFEAYVVEARKVVRLSGYTSFMGNLGFTGEWAQKVKVCDNYGEADLTMPWRKSLLKGTTAENSKLDIYMKTAKKPYPITYLRLWQKHKNVENLLTVGAGELLGDMIASDISCYEYYHPMPKGVPALPYVNWKAVRPAQMLNMNKDELAVCLSQKWMQSELQLFKAAKDAGVSLTAEEMRMAKELGPSSFYQVINKEQPLGKTIRYLYKYAEKSKMSYGTVNFLFDYRRMAQELGYNMEDPHVLFPKDLRAAHDRVMREKQTERDREAAEKKRTRARRFARRYKELSGYAWEKDGLLIRPCRNETELKKEGRELDHCVSTYAEKHASGATAIMFIRQSEAPEKPFYTLELNEERLTVIQNRGKCNCERTKQVKQFEKEWLEHIRNERMATKKIKKKEANAA